MAAHSADFVTVTGSSLIGKGEVARIQGDYVAARSLYEESLSLLREVRAIFWIGISLDNLAYVAVHQRDYKRARFKESLAIRVRLGHRTGIAYCLAGLASVAGEQNQLERAQYCGGAAEVILVSIGTHPYSTDRLEYLDTIGSVQGTLGKEAFQAAWAEGRAMTLEQAIEYALTEQSISAET